MAAVRPSAVAFKLVLSKVSASKGADFFACGASKARHEQKLQAAEVCKPTAVTQVAAYAIFGCANLIKGN